MVKPNLFTVIAAGAAMVFADMGAVQALDIKVGYTAILKADRRVNTVAVGDPTIAEASIAFGNTILLIGRAVGATNVVPLDDEGKEIFDANINVIPSNIVGRPVDIMQGVLVPSNFICYPRACVNVPPDAAVSGAGIASRSKSEGGERPQ